MKSGFWLFRLTHVALFGSLLLTGCPGAGDVEDGGVAALAVRVAEGDADECLRPPNLDAIIARVVELVNAQRTSRGLHPLTLDPVLCEIADDYCCEMIENGFFSHINPYTGDGPGQRAINGDYVFLAIGENLAGGQQTPEQVVADWMDSNEGHRENILAHQWQEIGVSVRVGGEHGVYWVLEFGNPP